MSLSRSSRPASASASLARDQLVRFYSAATSSSTPAATSTAASAPRARRIDIKNTPSLDHFIQHSRAISLYRTIVRGVTSLDPDMRRETLSFVRAEFERNKHVTDLSHIRYLISTGKTEWDAMRRYVGR